MVCHNVLFEQESWAKLPQNWPFALRHEHNLCKKKSCIEKCLPRLERCHGSLKGEVAHKTVCTVCASMERSTNRLNVQPFVQK